jgi:hypothetical protein
MTKRTYALRDDERELGEIAVESVGHNLRGSPVSSPTSRHRQVAIDPPKAIDRRCCELLVRDDPGTRWRCVRHGRDGDEPLVGRLAAARSGLASFIAYETRAADHGNRGRQ